MHTRTLRSLLIVLAVALAGAGCSGSSGSDAVDTSNEAVVTAAGSESAEAALADDRTVIDVRTPEEFDAGHVDGAELRDVQDPGFDAALDDLDPDGAYVVYCRTGSRSAAAAARMEAAGLDVLDGGSLEDMLDAGWAPSA